MFVRERLAVASLVLLSPCGSLLNSLDGKIIYANKQNGFKSICSNVRLEILDKLRQPFVIKFEGKV